jgi:hypothetical protein
VTVAKRVVFYWKRPKIPSAFNRPGRLSPEEEAATRIALKVLAVRHGGWPKLAKRMRVSVHTLTGAMFKKRKGVGPGIALEVARCAGVPVDDVLAGRFPEPGSCPHCGRKDPG